MAAEEVKPPCALAGRHATVPGMDTSPFGVDLLKTMLAAAVAGADHHLYYRTLNRAAGVIGGLAAQEGRRAVFLAEELLGELEAALGDELPGYGGRPLFPALRKRVAETLVEMGF